MTNNEGYKKRYTIGALFNPEMDLVLLIEKTKPEWQKGMLNLPGGHIEDGETAAECVRREFVEETGIDVDNWQHIGRIDNAGNYYIEFFTAVLSEDQVAQTLTDEKVDWHEVYDLPAKCISNLFWLVPFAANIHKQGNANSLKFGTFTYQNL